ncbi:UDP-N-acetylglucosamine 2-epimerase (non-hydrolyzing) [Microgenomates group bacterium]|nr:UDP-N-acetylglucosamine 2-epimerase (non-hydrolyzing) [Microgenomates group bacterium]
MKIGIILGTRPEIIKLSSVIRACRAHKLRYFIIHTNQHYSVNMDAVFFAELGLPSPRYHLEIAAKKHGEMVGRQLEAIEKILIKEKPTWVLVQGDTNTVMAGALAATKLGIKVGHVEAGLRSYDRTMPEEINRVVTDHVSDMLFAVGKRQEDILLGEGIDQKKILVTGNTIVDAVWQNLLVAEEEGVLRDLRNGYDPYERGWILLTTHRPSNVDSKHNLTTIINAATAISRQQGLPVIFPVHPRTQESLEELGIEVDYEGIIMVSPVGYLEMLSLIKAAKLIMTDSGGIQEEACILGVPSITLRENTERPETIEVGANILVGGSDEKRIIEGAEKILAAPRGWKNPFGDGRSGERIVSSINSRKSIR